jgi:hypothetical protein
MFQFPGLAPFRVIHLQCIRLSHSEISGLMFVCNYPELIAAYHVLLRLLVPRHPPYALIRFKYCISFVLAISGSTLVLFYYYLLFLPILGMEESKLLSQYVKDLKTPTPKGASSLRGKVSL